MSEEPKNNTGTAFEQILPQRQVRMLKLHPYFQVGEEPPELYAYPLTYSDMKALALVSDDAFSEIVETLKLKVLDKYGKPFFQLRDKGRMLNDVPMVALRHLYDQIADRPEKFDVLLGKSAATPS